MNFKNIKYAYFLGIGGIGMSAIARYFNHQGIKVYGYDKTETPLTKELQHEGIEVHYADLGVEIFAFKFDPKETLVVLTPAIPKDLQEWKWLRNNEFTIMKRSQVLGIISDEYKTIAVAGTHGKTTTSTLIAHILKQSKVDCAAFLGGISANYNSNLLLHKKFTDHGSQITDNTVNGEPSTGNKYLIVEADEFDRSFLTLHPSISIITSTDADHLDIYGKHEELKKSFLDFASQTKDTLIIKKELDLVHTLPLNHPEKDIKSPVQMLHSIEAEKDIEPPVQTLHATSQQMETKTYSIIEKADFYAKNIQIKGDNYFFDLHFENEILKELNLGIPGLHNVENAVAASAVAILSGVTEEELRSALASFHGVKRRFEYIIKTDKMVYIDDYAHHPEELKAIISSVKQMYRGKKVTAIFQPHLYSRTRDFVEGFAESLSLADDVLLLDIYPARELPIQDVSSEMVFNKMKMDHKMLCSRKDVLDIIEKKKPEVLLTLGAGDIDQLVEPLRLLLNNMKMK
ncbi:MAG: UDP-N-acetylmuramate--L-alanine ligase [Bacteroidia bacterium]